MRRILPTVALAVFLVNPGFACSDEPAFTFGATEMRAAVAGDWSLTITPAGGSALEVTIHLDQAAAPATTAVRVPGASLVRAAHACGTRTLVKSADACIDRTEMPLAVDYVSGDASFASATSPRLERSALSAYARQCSQVARCAPSSSLSAGEHAPCAAFSVRISKSSHEVLIDGSSLGERRLRD